MQEQRVDDRSEDVRRLIVGEQRVNDVEFIFLVFWNQQRLLLFIIMVLGGTYWGLGRLGMRTIFGSILS